MEQMTNDTPYWKERLSAHDTISRQAAIDALGEKPLAWTEDEYELGLQQQWEADVDAIKAVPSAHPEVTEEAVKEYCRKRCLCIVDSALLKKYASAQPDCSDCIKHGGDWDCDHVHCHKGKQPDKDMIHLQKEQAYLQGWEEGRKALREEIWEDGRDRLD